jgi:hypothetical protein
MYFNEIMNFHVDKNTTQISLTPDGVINVLKYLPIEDKYDLIAITLQQSDESGFYNPVKLHAYFELNTVLLYSNLEFTLEELEDRMKLYDVLKSHGIIDTVIDNIPENEWAELNTLYYDYLEKKEKYRNSIAGVINGFIDNLVPNAEEAAKIIENFDPEQFQNVINFAQAANGGRPIQ